MYHRILHEIVNKHCRDFIFLHALIHDYFEGKGLLPVTDLLYLHIIADKTHLVFQRRHGMCIPHYITHVIRQHFRKPNDLLPLSHIRHAMNQIQTV